MKKENKKALLISLIMILSMVVSTIYPTVSYALELGENSRIQSGSTNLSTGDENPPVPPSDDVVNPPIPEVMNPPIPPSDDIIEKPIKPIVPIPEVVKPSVSEEKNNKVKEDTVVNPPVPPKTRHNTTIIGVILLGLGAIIGIIILRRDKNTN